MSIELDIDECHELCEQMEAFARSCVGGANEGDAAHGMALIGAALTARLIAEVECLRAENDRLRRGKR